VAHSHRTYQPRDTEHSVLHAVIREHLEPFVREVTDRGDQRRDAPARFRGPPRCERPERCGRNARDRRRQPHWPRGIAGKSIAGRSGRPLASRWRPGGDGARRYCL